MDSFKGPCPHQSVPVEMDESMTSSNLDLVWPPACEQCSGHTQTRPQGPDRQPTRGTHTDGQRGSHESQYQHNSRAAQAARQTHPGQINSPHPASVWPGGLSEAQMHGWDFGIREHHSRGFAGPSNWPQDCSVEDTECLETPLPLMSDINFSYYGPKPKQGGQLRYCACCPPTDKRRHNYNYGYHNKQHYSEESHQDPRHHQHSWNPPPNRPQLQDPPNAAQRSGPQRMAPLRDVVHELSIDFPHRPYSGGPVTREIKKTISLPEECRNVFITYSVDTAQEIILFTKFLTDQGFKPAIDIFDNPIRRMGITKWMDRFLNDKSVLIIVVISPKYKEDVEGDGDDDDHGLHTKYIHNQIQNEFIQQGCRNFRLVPVLFPNATKKHVPNWLLSTRLYHWPQDTQDLLLRLLREERYIIPTHESDLTLTVRPL